MVVECEDRRLVRAAVDLALDTVVQDRAEVTVLLPRRTFRRLSQRLLHDRTADRIAEAVGRIPHVAATIVPYDTTLPHEVVEQLEVRQREAEARPALSGLASDDAVEASSTEPSNGIASIGSVSYRQKVTIEGRIKAVQVGTAAGRSLEVLVFDKTGGLRLLFFGRTEIPGIEPGTVLRATGRVGEYKGHLALANPRYELVRTCASV
jgi:DNA/RNA endonuclease YhcR with UshA esterase domain